MKHASLLFLFIFQLAFCQSDKVIKGKVLNNEIPIFKAEVINLRNQKVAITDAQGEFVLSANLNDSLVFYAKDFVVQKVQVNQEYFNGKPITVSLVKKPYELDEVEVTQVQFPKFTIQQIKAAHFEDDQYTAVKNPLIYDGSMPGSVNLLGLFTPIVKLFKKKSKSDYPAISFKDFLNKHFTNDDFVNTLQLQPDEVFLFKEFCNDDIKSKTIHEHQNVLAVMDFLKSKSVEFKKLRESFSRK